MKVTLRDIINFKDQYFRLLDQSFLPILTRRTLSKDGKKIIDEINQTKELSDGLVKKYGETSSDGTIIKINPDPNNLKTQSFQLEYNDLLDVEIELQTEPLDIELFMRDDCTLSAKDFIILEKIIVEVEKDKPEEKSN